MVMSHKLIDDVAARVMIDKYKGKDIAFVSAKLRPDDPMHVLAIVVKDEDGYEPLPWQLAWAFHAPVMERHADDLNDRLLHLTQMQVAHFVASSMKTIPRRSG